MEENLRESAKKLFESWVLKNKLFQKTPVYRRLLEPAVSFVLSKEETEFGTKDGEFYLKHQDEDATTVEVTITDINICSFHVSVLIDRWEGLARFKKLISITGTDSFSGSLQLDIRLIRNTFRCQEKSTCIVDVQEEERKSTFTADGLEEKREQSIYTSDHPFFTNGCDMVLGATSGTRYPIEYVPLTEKQCLLQLSHYYSSSATILPSFAKSDIVVCAQEDEKKICFPYFHDEEGWIITEPFMSDAKLQLDTVRTYTFVGQDRMGKCDIASMDEYLAKLKESFNKLETDRKLRAPRLSLSFDVNGEK